jgi:hypothetical protein
MNLFCGGGTPLSSGSSSESCFEIEVSFLLYSNVEGPYSGPRRDSGLDVKQESVRISVTSLCVSTVLPTEGSYRCFICVLFTNLCSPLRGFTLYDFGMIEFGLCHSQMRGFPPSHLEIKLSFSRSGSGLVSVGFRGEGLGFGV